MPASRQISGRGCPVVAVGGEAGQCGVDDDESSRCVLARGRRCGPLVTLLLGILPLRVAALAAPHLGRPRRRPRPGSGTSTSWSRGRRPASPATSRSGRSMSGHVMSGHGMSGRSGRGIRGRSQSGSQPQSRPSTNPRASRASTSPATIWPAATATCRAAYSRGWRLRPSVATVRPGALRRLEVDALRSAARYAVRGGYDETDRRRGPVAAQPRRRPPSRGRVRGRRPGCARRASPAPSPTSSAVDLQHHGRDRGRRVDTRATRRCRPTSRVWDFRGHQVIIECALY